MSFQRPQGVVQAVKGAEPRYPQRPPRRFHRRKRVGKNHHSACRDEILGRAGARVRRVIAILGGTDSAWPQARKGHAARARLVARGYIPQGAPEHSLKTPSMRVEPQTHVGRDHLPHEGK